MCRGDEVELRRRTARRGNHHVISDNFKRQLGFGFMISMLKEPSATDFVSNNLNVLNKLQTWL